MVSSLIPLGSGSFYLKGGGGGKRRVTFNLHLHLFDF